MEKLKRNFIEKNFKCEPRITECEINEIKIIIAEPNQSQITDIVNKVANSVLPNSKKYYNVEYKELLLLFYVLDELSNIPAPKEEYNDDFIPDLDRMSKIKYFLDGADFKVYYLEWYKNLSDLINKKIDFEISRINKNANLDEIIEVVKNMVVSFSGLANSWIDKLEDISKEEIEVVVNGMATMVKNKEFNTKDIANIIQSNFIDNKLREKEEEELINSAMKEYEDAKNLNNE